MKNIVKFILPLILVIGIPVLFFLQKQENDIQKFDKITKAVYEEFAPTGLSVAIVKDNQIVYEKNLGYKNKENLSALNSKSIFNIASCSKAFTAAAIGKLVEEGLVSWNDKVTDYIPDFKLADDCITQSITLEDILCHRTGLATFYGDLLWYNSSYNNKEVIRRMQYLPITKKFRAGIGYQNNMFMIAGEIVKEVTGQSWETFIKQNFFTPLEMNETRSSSDLFDGNEDLAFPHYNDSIIGIYYFLAGKPAASMWSNTRDLANWAMMFLNNGKWKDKQILSEETIQKLTASHTVIPVSEEKKKMGIHFRSAGLGWFLYDYNGRKIIEHNGGMPGYLSKVALIPEENMAIIILNNGFEMYSNNTLFYSYVDIATQQYTKDWLEQAKERKVKAEEKRKELKEKRASTRKPDTKPSLALNNYAGMYNDMMYGDAEVKLKDGILELTLLPAQKVFTGTLEHWADDVFKVEFKDPFLPYGLVHFSTNDKGKIIGFKIDLPSSDFHFKNLDFKKL